MAAILADVNPFIAAARAPAALNGRDVALACAMAARASARSPSTSGNPAAVSAGAPAKKRRAAKPLSAAVSAEAAPKLEHLVLEITPDEKTGNAEVEDQLHQRRPRRRRMDLSMRVALRRKKIRRLMMLNSRRRQKRKAGSADSGGAAGAESTGIWSDAVSRLVQDHGGACADMVLQKWSSLENRLLTVDEERWLASLMHPYKRLVALKEALSEQLGRVPDDDEWALAANMDLTTIARHVAVFEAARNKLVKMNLRLVKHQARKYNQEASGSNLSFIDLCQEGVKGLMIAVERFDPNKGFKFSTYAIFWIRNSILRAQTRSGYPIRSPFNFAEIKMNVNKVKWELKSQGEDDRGDASKLRKTMLERVGVGEERYKTIMRSNRRLISLHQRDRVTGNELIENLADPLSSSVNSNYLVGSGGGKLPSDPSIRLAIDDVLDSLKPKESLILRQRFGLDGKGERALGEIGRNMRISREMVRKYEARGLLKLKHPTRLSYLRSFLSHDS